MESKFYRTNDKKSSLSNFSYLEYTSYELSLRKSTISVWVCDTPLQEGTWGRGG